MGGWGEVYAAVPATHGIKLHGLCENIIILTV